MIEVNLAYIVCAMLVFFVLLFYLIKSKKQIENNAYELKKIMTNWEISTLNEMINYAPKEWIICPQVRLADILTINYKTSKEKYTKLNKVASKSIDFVIVNESGLPVLAIECDDKSHNKKDRIKRDGFVNNIFETIGVKLIRVKPYTETKWAEIFEEIKNKTSHIPAGLHDAEAKNLPSPSR